MKSEELWLIRVNLSSGSNYRSAYCVWSTSQLRLRRKGQLRTVFSEWGDLKPGIQKMDKDGGCCGGWAQNGNSGVQNASFQFQPCRWDAGQVTHPRTWKWNVLGVGRVCVFLSIFHKPVGLFLLLRANCTLIGADAVAMVIWTWMFLNFGTHLYHGWAQGIT